MTQITEPTEESDEVVEENEDVAENNESHFTVHFEKAVHFQTQHTELHYHNFMNRKNMNLFKSKSLQVKVTIVI